eukprot:Opistho-2@95538
MDDTMLKLLAAMPDFTGAQLQHLPNPVQPMDAHAAPSANTRDGAFVSRAAFDALFPGVFGLAGAMHAHGPHPHDDACPWATFDLNLVSPTLHAFGIDDPTLSSLTDSSLACLYGAPCPMPLLPDDMCLDGASPIPTAVMVSACAAQPHPHQHSARTTCPILPRVAPRTISSAQTQLAAKSNYEKIAAQLDRRLQPSHSQQPWPLPPGDGSPCAGNEPAIAPVDAEEDNADDALDGTGPSGSADDASDGITFSAELVDSVRARRSMHTTTERARRASLRAGFDDLQSVVPKSQRSLVGKDGRMGGSGAGKGKCARASKASLLSDAAGLIRSLRAQLDGAQVRVRSLEAEMRSCATLWHG